MSTADDYQRHWDEKFSAREWGRYPPEELVRFMGRNFRDGDRSRYAVLEVGCGPGANLWFLHREGYRVTGIDGSPAAIERARRRLQQENAELNPLQADLRVGNIRSLPFADNCFDVVIDIFALYANTVDVIEDALAEIYRVLKPGGRFFSKLWGTGTTGFGEGRELEAHTFDEIPRGPCFDMGVTHFFDDAEIRQRFGRFRIDAIDRVVRSDQHSDSQIEELVCSCTRPGAE